MNKRFVFLFCGLVLFLALAAFPAVTSANNSWNGYHWARTSNPFTLKLGDNTSGVWTSMLSTASTDWTTSTMLNTNIVAGGAKPRNCRPTSGRDEICNANYGNTGWLGMAQIWLTGGTHITQGTVKNNDYYFGSSTYFYNNPAEMQHVICQEIGHTLGLDHQSTDGSSQNTCMDYYHNTSAADLASTHPNQHDYDELAIIYAHLDGFNTIGSATSKLPPGIANGDFDEPGEWGKHVRTSGSGRTSTYERDFGGGNKIVTLVIWAR